MTVIYDIYTSRAEEELPKLWRAYVKVHVYAFEHDLDKTSGVMGATWLLSDEKELYYGSDTNNLFCVSSHITLVLTQHKLRPLTELGR